MGCCDHGQTGLTQVTHFMCIIPTSSNCPVREDSNCFLFTNKKTGALEKNQRCAKVICSDSGFGLPDSVSVTSLLCLGRGFLDTWAQLATAWSHCQSLRSSCPVIARDPGHEWLSKVVLASPRFSSRQDFSVVLREAQGLWALNWGIGGFSLQGLESPQPQYSRAGRIYGRKAKTSSENPEK